MHELSVVMGIVKIAEQEAQKAGAKNIDKIELEIGKLAGIDLQALDFVWESAVAGSLLQRADRQIIVLDGKATCTDCEQDFELENYFDACPNCHGYLKIIHQGKELRIKALEVS